MTFPRLVARTFARSLKGLPCCNGNKESLYRAFLHKDSILLWAFTSEKMRRRGLLQDIQHVPHVRLREERDVDRWLRRAGLEPVNGAARPRRS